MNPIARNKRPEPAPLELRAAFSPETVDAEARTVELVWTTGASVRRYRWEGFSIVEYDQTLSLDDGAVLTEFLDSGRAPYLDAHNSRSNDSVLGVIEEGSVVVEDGEGRARVRFDDSELAEKRFRSVTNGILRNVSVGFKIHENAVTREADPKAGILEERTATSWEPFELSQVPIGADSGASIRAARAFAASHPQPEVSEMSDSKPEALSAEERARIEAESRAAGAKAEQARQAGIRLAARTLRLDDAPICAELLGDVEVSLDAARARLLDAAADADDASSPSSARSTVTVGREESEKRGAGIVDGLLARAFGHIRNEDGSERFPVESGSVAAEYRHRSLIDIARDCLERRGVDTRFFSTGRIADEAMRGLSVRMSPGMISTDDFPNLLADVAHKSLRMGYDTAPRTFTAWARRTTANDFKTIRRIQLSGGLALERVEEGGEFTSGGTFESQETYNLATFGRIIAITRQTLINDDLDGFSRVGQIYGAAAADLESDTVYDLITDNGNMADGTAIFHADHSNLAALAGAPTAARIAEGREAMRLQTDLDDERLLNLAPKFLVFPAALELVMDQELGLFMPATTGEVTPQWIRALTPIAEPRLDAASDEEWYMFAEPSRVDTVEYAYLSGEEGVQMSTRAGFEVDGVEVKARLDFGAGVIDHRGMFKNDGA